MKMAKILIIEDSAFERKAIINILGKDGYEEVVEAEIPVETAQESSEEVAEAESDVTKNTDVSLEVDASENEAEQEK